jgi:hypothetical protein
MIKMMEIFLPTVERDIIPPSPAKIAPPKEPRTDAHFEKSGDVGDSGEDTF